MIYWLKTIYSIQMNQEERFHYLNTQEFPFIQNLANHNVIETDSDETLTFIKNTHDHSTR